MVVAERAIWSLIAVSSFIVANTLVVAAGGHAQELAGESVHLPENSEVDTGNAWWFATKAHGTLVSSLVDRQGPGLSIGATLAAGHRWNDFGLLVQVDNTWWGEVVLAPEDAAETFTAVPQSVIGLSIGFDHLYFGERMRFMSAVGATVLLRNTVLDDAGTFGLWIDFNPIGVRIRRRGRVARWLTFDPLALTLLLPDMTGIPLVLIQFRTVISVDFDFGSGTSS